MGTTAVALDPGAARAVAGGITATLGGVAGITAGCRADEAAGMLDGATTSAVALLEEITAEMGLAAQLLEAIADGAEAADSFTVGDGFSAQVEAALQAATVYDALTTSLADGTGATPTDAVDPDLAGDHDYGLGHFGWMPLFDEDGPTPDDVEQGWVGDCWLLSAFSSVAAVDPGHIRGMITDHGDGTYTVHFTEGDVTVDDQLPYRVTSDGTIKLVYAGGEIGPGVPIWPAIVEKAQAIAMGGDYDDISSDRSTTAFEDFGFDTESLNLNPRWRRDPSDSSVAELIESQLDEGLPISASSGGIFGMGGGHAWSVVGIEDRGDETWVTVRNPWGSDGFNDDGGSVQRNTGDGSFESDDHAGFVEIGDNTDGLITMRIDVFTANFRRLDLVEAP